MQGITAVELENLEQMIMKLQYRVSECCGLVSEIKKEYGDMEGEIEKDLNFSMLFEEIGNRAVRVETSVSDLEQVVHELDDRYKEAFTAMVYAPPEIMKSLRNDEIR